MLVYQRVLVYVVGRSVYQVRLAVVQTIRQLQFVWQFLVDFRLVLFVRFRQEVARFRLFGSIERGRTFELARLVQLLVVELRLEQLLFVYFATLVQFLADQFPILFFLAVHFLLSHFRLHRAVFERDHRSHGRVVLLHVDLRAG